MAIVSATGTGEPEPSPGVVWAAERSITGGVRTVVVVVATLVGGRVTDAVVVVASLLCGVAAEVGVNAVVGAVWDETVAAVGALVAGGTGAIAVVLGEPIAAFGRMPGFA